MRVRNFITEEVAKLSYATANAKETNNRVLTGVLLDFPRQLAVATDQKVMAMAHLRLPSDYALLESVIVSTEFLEAAYSLGSACDIEITPTKSYIYAAGKKTEYANVQGTYPDYGKVLPERRQEVKLTINLSLVSTLLKALGLGKKDGVTLCFDPTNPTHPARIAKGDKTLGLVMPMRY